MNERASTNEYEVRKSLTDFFENLYELAENCQFCSLTEELIHDSIVVGIRLDSFSQKLMQDDRFKPDKAITEIKLSELVKEHHEILKANENGKLEGKINRVHSMEKSHPKPRNMKENERSKVQKPHRKFPAKTNRPYTSEKNAKQCAYNVQNKDFMLQCQKSVKTRLFVQFKKKHRVKPLIQINLLLKHVDAHTAQTRKLFFNKQRSSYN